MPSYFLFINLYTKVVAACKYRVVLLLFIKKIPSDIILYPVNWGNVFGTWIFQGKGINSVVSIDTLVDLSESVLPRITCFVEKLCLTEQIWAAIIEVDPFIPPLPYRLLDALWFSRSAGGHLYCINRCILKYGLLKLDSGQDEVDSFPLFLLLRTTENSRCNTKSNCKKTLKGGKNEVDWLGTLELEERHGSEFLALSFCPLYIQMGTGEAHILEMPTGTDRKQP